MDVDSHVCTVGCITDESKSYFADSLLLLLGTTMTAAFAGMQLQLHVGINV